MASRKTAELSIDGRSVTVSNLDKVLYPSGFTKGQVIDYYVRVSEYVLPHLAGRPVTLKRYPNGVNAKHFYEKDAPAYTPQWVRTFPVPRRSGESDINYVVIDDLASLVWSANTASLELHPFLHRVPEISTPTALVFDLDPGEGADVLTCAEVAFLLKGRLESSGLQSFAKVSGSKGMQVYVPLNTKITYAETQPFAHSLAEQLEREHPGLIVSAMTKARRTGKVFIDWSQNADFKTTVGVYSLRAKRSAPYVSMPLRWDELRAALDEENAARLDFEPEVALQRLRKTGDLFEPVLTLKQHLTRTTAHATAPPKLVTAEKSARVRLADLPAAPLHFLEPMRAELVANLPDGARWQHEIKFDGYRALALKKNGEVTLISRNNRVLNRRFPKIATALATLEADTMIDGEIVALDRQGRPSFNLLQNYQRSEHPLYYYVFDLLALRGKSLLHLTLRQRREILEQIGIGRIGDPIRISEALHASAEELVRTAREQKLEGLVAKRLDSIYQPGAKGGAWVKFKVNRSQELVIGGYIPGKLHFDSLLVGYYEGRKLIFNAKVKNGFVPRVRQELYKNFQALETPRCPFANLPEPKNARRGEALTAEVMKKCRWLKPVLVAQIEFTEWTAANHLRHSRFGGLRDDKDPHEVVRESAA